MQFTCGKCSTRYSVPDEKVRGKRIRTRCRKCGAEILVEGPPASAGGGGATAPDGPGQPQGPKAATAPKAPPAGGGARPAAPASRVATEERWTVAKNRTERSKMTTTEISQAFVDGALGSGTLVWKHGMDTWKAPFDVPAVALALAARGVRRMAAKATRPSQAPAPPPREPAPVAAPLATPGGEGLAWGEDEATRVLDSGTDHPLLAAPSHPTSAPPPRGDPSDAFAFEHEATAVMAPDRAGALLEAEIGKSGPPTAGAEDAGTETPVAFGFDDEATQVFAPEKASDLTDPPALRASDRPPAFPVPIPAAGTPAPPARDPASVAVAPGSAPGGRPGKPKEKESTAPPAAAARALVGLQNEPTRVVRVRRKPMGAWFWVVVLLSLAAAAAGGFLASQLLQPRSPAQLPP